MFVNLLFPIMIYLIKKRIDVITPILFRYIQTILVFQLSTDELTVQTSDVAD